MERMVFSVRLGLDQFNAALMATTFERGTKESIYNGDGLLVGDEPCR
jgi:hypothetical protein